MAFSANWYYSGYTLVLIIIAITEKGMGMSTRRSTQIGAAVALALAGYVAPAAAQSNSSGADIEEIQLIVFDRLGKEVFRTTNVQVATQEGWDGKNGGEDQPAGTYSWVLNGKRRNGNPLSFQGKSYGQVVLMR